MQKAGGQALGGGPGLPGHPLFESNPSRGFSSGAPLSLSIPDATIRCEQGHVIIEVDHHALPKLSINQDYADMLHKSDDPAVQDYIKEQLGRPGP